jgi:FtsX-like permease family
LAVSDYAVTLRRRRFRLRAPLAVAGARLRARPGRALLVVAGVAAAVAALAGVVGGSLVAQDKTLQRQLAALPPSERSFRVDSFGLPGGATYAAADRQVRTALARLTARAPYRLTSFRTLNIGGELVRLAALDGLPQIARLVSGRWPRECTPARCEVVQVGRGGGASLDSGGIHLVRVGIAEVPAEGVFGESLSTSSDVAQQRHTYLLLANGAASFERLPTFADLFRTYSWIAPLDPSHLHIWQVAGILARESGVQGVLERDGDTYQLTGPDAALLAARQDGHVASERMVIVGGEISALLLGFALVAAIGLRRGVWNESRRLSQRGARRTQIWLAVATEIGTMALAGAVIGIVAGTLAVVVVSRAAGLPTGSILGHSLGTLTGVAIVVGAWAVASVAIVIAVRAPERRRGRGIRILDVAAIGALAAVAIGVSSGKVSAGSLAAPSGERLLFTLLPGLVCFVAAVAAGRLLGPAMRLAERWTRNAGTAVHLAFLVLARAPARTVATVGFLLVAIGLALFAVSYRATLADGARDEAAYAVPLDYTVTEGSQLVLPLSAAPVSRYDSLAPGTAAYPILRRTASVAGSGATIISPTVLGVPAAALAKLHWRSDFSSLSPAAIAKRVGAGGPVSLRGVAIPAGARTLTMTVHVRGIPVQFVLVGLNRAGNLVMLPLGARSPGTWKLTARVPQGFEQLTGLEVSISPLTQHELAHGVAEGAASVVPAGSAVLGPLRAGGMSVTDWSGWLARNGGSLSGRLLHYSFLSGQTVVVRLPQVTDGQPLAALVSPNVAGTTPVGGTIELNFQTTQLPARIVGIASRFPASDDEGQGFVVVDESRLATALSADAPGTATPDELWVSGPKTLGAQLARPPFATLVVSSRRNLQHQLASDPLARGITLTLTAAGLIAVLLAAVGFWLTLVSDARDERGELFDLEAQGVPPATLRKQLRVRSLVLVAFGALGGLALGLVLARLVVSVISVSAETTDPSPPLRYDPDWTTLLIGLAALVAVVLALIELTARHALRGDTPSRASWSLE